MMGCVGGSGGCQQHCQQSYALLRSYHLITSDLRGPSIWCQYPGHSDTRHINAPGPLRSQDSGIYLNFYGRLTWQRVFPALIQSKQTLTVNDWSQAVTLLPSCVKCHCFKNGCCQNPGEPSPSLIESKWFKNVTLFAENKAWIVLTDKLSINVMTSNTLWRENLAGLFK